MDKTPLTRSFDLSDFLVKTLSVTLLTSFNQTVTENTAALTLKMLQI